MKYMGSKNRIAKYILPIILKDRKPGQWYIEPFVGGANIIDKVDGNRIGFDKHVYLIKALELIKNDPYDIPDLITENDYQKAKTEMKIDGITGFVGFAMSFGGKWFGGYRRDVAGTKGCIENMKTQSRRSKQSAIKQSQNLKDVILQACDYKKLNNLNIPPKSIIYCDPPYANTTKYKHSFNHDEFFAWCLNMSNLGHTVFVSEYSAPESFECVWEKEIVSSLTKNTGSKRGVERLFKPIPGGKTCKT